jgi:2-phosphoglycerate kinase
MDYYAESMLDISIEIIKTDELIEIYNNKLKQTNPNNPEYKKIKNKIKTLKKELILLERIMNTV